jgi:energy-coupling factor transport system permease protein
MKNAITWMIWLIAVVVVLLSTRNPAYLISLLIGLFVVGHRLARKKNNPSWVLPNLRFLFTMIVLSTIINGLFSHIGNLVLFTLPQGWPLVGGKITLESLAYGAINGLVIGALYLVFSVLNLALSIKQITRLIPRAFHPIATMITISLTFFPSIQLRAREIKEAQMIRGNAMKKVSDWLQILIPLLVTSLENAILLSESMTARGFHKQNDLRSPRALISLILSAFAIFVGWILQLYRYPPLIFVSLYLLGGGVTLLTFINIGKSTIVTRYHHDSWRKADIIMTGLISLFLAGFSTLSLLNHLPSLDYSPYPTLTLPSMQWIGLLFSLIPMLPLLVLNHD